MLRWSTLLGDNVEDSTVDAFLEDVIALSKRYGLSIAHEDYHGSFLVKPYNDDCTEWLRKATIEDD